MKINKKKKIFFAVFGALIIPTAIVGTSFFLLSFRHKDKSNINDIFVPESDGKINMNLETPFGFYDPNESEMIPKIKDLLTKTYTNVLDINFTNFVISDVKYDTSNGFCSFRAYEKLEYQIDNYFKFKIEKLDNFLNKDKNIGNIIKFENSEDNFISIISNPELYSNSTKMQQMMKFYEEGKISIIADENAEWNNNDNLKKYNAKIEYNELDFENKKELIDSMTFTFFSSFQKNGVVTISPEMNSNILVEISNTFVGSKKGFVSTVDDKFLNFKNDILISTRIENDKIVAYSSDCLFLLRQESDSKIILESSIEFSDDLKFIYYTSKKQVLAVDQKGNIFDFDIGIDNSISFDQIFLNTNQNDFFTSMIEWNNNLIFTLGEDEQGMAIVNVFKNNEKFDLIQTIESDEINLSTGSIEKMKGIKDITKIDSNLFLIKTKDNDYHEVIFIDKGNNDIYIAVVLNFTESKEYSDMQIYNLNYFLGASNVAFGFSKNNLLQFYNGHFTKIMDYTEIITSISQTKKSTIAFLAGGKISKIYSYSELIS